MGRHAARRLAVIVFVGALFPPAVAPVVATGGDTTGPTVAPLDLQPQGTISGSQALAVAASITDATGVASAEVSPDGGATWYAMAPGMPAFGGTSISATASLNAKIVQVVGRRNHVCALTWVGAVWCWGSNASGQFQSEASLSVPTPAPVPGVTDGISIAAGGEFACALRAGGGVVCWGNNVVGQRGDGSVADARAIAAGGQHACALRGGGGVACWGGNSNGQLGNGTTGSSSATPVAVGNLANAIAVGAGEQHSCAIVAGGAVRCWGLNGSGELGDGTVVAKFTPVAVLDITSATAVVGGNAFTCALLADRRVACWGNNAYGQLGIPVTTASSARPVIVPDASTAIGLAAGESGACAVLDGGGFRCWGQIEPPEPGTLDGVASIAVGIDHACAARSDGTARCWGANLFGQLGSGTSLANVTPVAVPALVDAIDVAMGNKDTCAILSSGGVRCLGWPIGATGVTSGDRSRIIVGVSDATSIVHGQEHACALVSDGTVRCWGSGSLGQLGNGSTTASAVGVAVTSVTDATAITSSASHTCAIVTAGALRCWGYNLNGQLGNGSTTDSSTAVSVQGLTLPVTAVATGGGHTCAILSDHTVRCWGNNSFYQLGDGTNTQRTSPVAVTSVTDATAIAAGGSHTCVLRTGGAVACWGYNASNQVGSVTGYTFPTPFTAIASGAIGVIAVDSTSCALMASRQVRCWGGNGFGLGTGKGSEYSAATVVGIDDAEAISAGRYGGCARRTSGAVSCWGSNEWEQLGFRTQGPFPFPTPALIRGIAPALPGGARVCVRATDLLGNVGAEACANVSTAPGAPSITLQPQNQTIRYDQTATFTATATGAPTPTIRWQSSASTDAPWVDVLGATATTYSTAVSGGDTGKRFRAIFSNTAGDATTNAATLTVAVPAATAYTVTGPAGGLVNVTSGDFTITPNGALGGSVTVTPSGGGLSSANAQTFVFGSYLPKTFRIRPTAIGPVALAFSNTGSVANPATRTYATEPGAPTIGAVTAGQGQVSVAFTATTATGGSPIRFYRATSSPGGIEATAATSPIVVAGLTDGTAYTFTIRTVNAIGASAPSAASASVIPAPLATAYSVAGPAGGAVNVASSNFTITPNGRLTATVTVTPSGGGLSRAFTRAFSNSAVPQTFTITPTAVGPVVLTFTNNATGVANASQMRYATPPGAPVIGAVTPGDRQVSVAFTPPSLSGGDAIRYYRVVASPGGREATGNTSPIVVTDLTNGTAYTFTVRAVNGIGQSAASAASASSTPRTTPSAPRETAAAALAGSAVVTWLAPASTGGSSITGYTVTRYVGGTSAGTTACAATATSCSVTNLTNGTAYTFTVTATNVAGTSAASVVSNSVTPQATTFTLTAAKTGVGTVTSGDRRISCGATCSASYATGSRITLTAVPSTGSIFFGWSGGGCAGNGTCTVDITAATTVTAAFRAVTTLTYTGTTSAARSTTITLSATLRAGTTAISGATISFTLNGSTFTATTNNSGVASVTAAAPASPGSYPIGVGYAGSSAYTSASTSASLTVT